jgi:serine/threonine-protein kinase
VAEWQGRTLSKVQIQHRLGRGGMAEVYAGHHTTLHRQVAVKILHAYLADNEALRRRFEAEAQAIAALRHPNIVDVYDFDLFEGQPYIVMEFVDGLALSEYLSLLHQAERTLSRRPLPASSGPVERPGLRAPAQHRSPRH